MRSVRCGEDGPTLIERAAGGRTDLTAVSVLPPAADDRSVHVMLHAMIDFGVVWHSTLSRASLCRRECRRLRACKLHCTTEYSRHSSPEQFAKACRCGLSVVTNLWFHQYRKTCDKRCRCCQSAAWQVMARLAVSHELTLT